MRDGKAVLHNPETNAIVGDFTERCSVTGSARAKVIARQSG
jgi:hypothetical protein